jgi:2-polyprenyl-3-methyl-5-hydroxy-6-metoxy-1,4-benzoquinol methylase
MDLIAESRTDYKNAILSLLEKDSHYSIMDLGSGDYKRLTLKVAKYVQATNITTIDLDGVRWTGQQDGFNFTHYVHDLNLIYTPSEKVDVVISSQVIEHLWNTDEFMRTIQKSLKASGYLILSTPNLASWHNVLYLLLGKQPEVAAVSNELYPWKEQPGHCRVFTSTELVKFVEFHGFKVEKILATSYYPFMGRLSKLMSRLDWKHAGMITIKARKL